MESILISIKKLLGIAEEYPHFDADIIMHINSVFLALNQLGVGPKEVFKIQDQYATWGDFAGDTVDLEAVKIYMYDRVRLAFDPPASSAALSAMERQAAELEWRLNVQVDT